MDRVEPLTEERIREIAREVVREEMAAAAERAHQELLRDFGFAADLPENA